MGIAKGYEGLGRLKGAGIVKNIFYEPSRKNLRRRQDIADALKLIPSDSTATSFGPMVERAFDLVTGLPNVNVATFTRLLAIRSPDRFVSVTGMSTAGLSKLSGISQKDLHTAPGYVDLIRWVMRQPWWNTNDPGDGTSLYWRNRAALLDILAYAGDNSSGMDAAQRDRGEEG